MCSDRLSEGKEPFCVQACPVEALEFALLEAVQAQAAERALAVGGAVYGEHEAGGTHVLHALAHPPSEHAMPPVGLERYPKHRIPLGRKLKGLFTVTGGMQGKWRAVANALTKP